MNNQLRETLCLAIEQLRPHVARLQEERFSRLKEHYEYQLTEAALDIETGWNQTFAHITLEAMVHDMCLEDEVQIPPCFF